MEDTTLVPADQVPDAGQGRGVPANEGKGKEKETLPILLATYTKQRKALAFNGQPPVICSVTIDLSHAGSDIRLAPSGRSGENGDDEKCYHDLQTLTTGLAPVKGITVSFKKFVVAGGSSEE